MNTQKKMESQLVSTVEANTSISFPSFESYDCESLFPDLVNNIKYPPYELVLQQPHSSHYSTQVQLMQSGFNQGIKYPTISEQMIRSNYGPFGREESLQTKSTGLEPPRNNATMGDNSNLSWEMPSRAQHGASHPSSWLGTTMIQSAVQSGGAAAGKQRIRWTHELHEQFVEAVNCLGGAMKATPKGILRLMKSQGLTVFHIKSHLQKYRNAKCVPNFLEGRSGRKTTDGMPISDFKGNGGFHISETLCLQKDVQRTLHEHLEFQRKLQLRIEEHSKHLHSMFDQQKRSCSFVEHHNSNKAIDPSVAGCSSAGVFEEPGKIYLTKQEP